MAVLNLSFSACGFLGIYQLGVAEALLRHGAKLLGSVKTFAGASAGSLVATVLVTAPEKLEHVKDFAYRFASDVRKQKFGAMTPGYDFMLKLREGLEDILPPNAHEIAGDRLHVSITHARTRKNCMVSHFASREDLIKVLLASSFVPVYAGIKGVEYKGQTWVDGGLTNWLPVLPVGRTITVSPFCGSHDICPKHEDLISIKLTLADMPIMMCHSPSVLLETPQSGRSCAEKSRCHTVNLELCCQRQMRKSLLLRAYFTL
ncbi:patatin-like phospholipase domain-containing protein 4 isoform X1 [Scleropages formosus]|uniref:PNPLA domain-containing protein n=1 Tax=Scleropages formosus TaxID=113540 RepID=A0A8C9V9Z1_SCLFO|nr:patatin-like phospholipase domain-containing protein 4 isoform X1 [Scleropages formosus]